MAELDSVNRESNGKPRVVVCVLVFVRHGGERDRPGQSMTVKFVRFIPPLLRPSIMNYTVDGEEIEIQNSMVRRVKKLSERETLLEAL